VESYDTATVLAGDFWAEAPERCRSAFVLARRELARPMRLIMKPEGFALAVKVVPGSSQQKIVGEYADGLKVTVTAAPERGAANDAVIALLADSLRTATGNVRIVRGHSSPRKEVLIVGLTAEEIERRLLCGQ
jgi:uncharacterized protein (TIGR00251 family)